MIGNGILETTTGATTGDLTLTGVTNRPRFSDFFTANATEAQADIFCYSILTQDTIPILVEQGIGWLSATGTLKRATVLVTYSGGVPTFMGSAAALSSGTTYNVICSPEAYLAGGAGIHGFSNASGARRGIGMEHQSGVGSSGSNVKDRLVYVPIRVATPLLATSINFQNGATAGAGGTRGWRIGLYSCLRNGNPGRKLEESGNITSTSYGSISYTFASARRLLPGWYYMAVVHDYATTVPTIYAHGNGTNNGISDTPAGNADPVNRQMGLYEALTAGWTGLPSVASSSLTAISPGGGVYAPNGTIGVQ